MWRWCHFHNWKILKEKARKTIIWWHTFISAPKKGNLKLEAYKRREIEILCPVPWHCILLLSTDCQNQSPHISFVLNKRGIYCVGFFFNSSQSGDCSRFCHPPSLSGRSGWVFNQYSAVCWKKLQFLVQGWVGSANWVILSSLTDGDLVVIV